MAAPADVEENFVEEPELLSDELFRSLNRRDYDSLQRMLMEGADVNSRDSRGDTLLIQAVTNFAQNVDDSITRLAIIALILDFQPDLSLKNSSHHIAYDYADTTVKELFFQYAYYRALVWQPEYTEWYPREFKQMVETLWTMNRQYSHSGILPEQLDLFSMMDAQTVVDMVSNVDALESVIRKLATQFPFSYTDRKGNGIVALEAMDGHVEHLEMVRDAIRRMSPEGSRLFDVNAVNKDGDTPLIKAVQLEQPEAIETLLAFPQLNFDQHGSLGRTPLMVSIIREHFRITDQLLNYIKTLDHRSQRNAVQVVDTKGFTALMHLVRERPRERGERGVMRIAPYLLVLKLVNMMDDITTLNRDQETALMLSVRHEILTNRDVNAALHVGIRENLRKITTLLVERSTSDLCLPNFSGEHALIYTLVYNDVNLTRSILEKLSLVSDDECGNLINYGSLQTGMTAIMKACQRGLEYFPVINFLYQRGASLVQTNLEGANALSISARLQDRRLMKWIMRVLQPMFTDPTDYRLLLSQAIYFALQVGNLRAVKTLEKSGGDLWYRNPHTLNDTALFALMDNTVRDDTPEEQRAGRLMETRTIEIIDYLLQRGVDVNDQDSRGETALFIAANNNLYHAAQELISRGAKIDIENEDHETVLSVSLKHGNLELIELLFEYGVEDNAQPIAAHLLTKTLIKATRAHNLRLVEYVIARGVDVNSVFGDSQGTDEDGENLKPALTFAAMAGYVDIVRALLAAPDINVDLTTDDDPSTALMYAVQNEYDDICELLLEAGADPNKRGRSGIPVLVFVYYRHGRHVRITNLDKCLRNLNLLLEHGADPNIRDRDGKTPLLDVIEKDYVPLALRLLAVPNIILRAPESRKKKPRPVLFAAVDTGSIELVEAILERLEPEEINAKHKYMTALSRAVTQNVAMVQLLLDRGADINLGTPTPLDNAIRFCKHEMATFLIEHGAVFTDRTFCQAVCNGHTDTIRTLLDRQVDVIHTTCGASRNTPLIYATNCHKLETVELLLDRGARDTINYQNEYGESALLESCRVSLPIFKLLVENGAEIHTKNKRGENILMVASNNNRTDIVEYILDHYSEAIDINDRDELGQTALFKVYTVDTAALLLDHGIDMNTRDHLGQTALQNHITNKSVEVAQFLIDRGAEHTPQDLANLRQAVADIWEEENGGGEGDEDEGFEDEMMLEMDIGAGPA